MKSVGIGTGSSHSKYFKASSSHTTGAKGRNFSRCLTFKFRMDCMSLLVGLDKILRLPKALGPHSIRPWNQPTTWFEFSNLAVIFTSSPSSLNGEYFILF